MKMFILLGIDEDSFGPAVVYRHATYFDCYDKKLVLELLFYSNMSLLNLTFYSLHSSNFIFSTLKGFYCLIYNLCGIHIHPFPLLW